MKKSPSLLYEKFHKKIKLQKRIIGKKNFTYRLILDILEPNLGDEKKVLDVGCGAGTLSFYMASKGNYVKGIDISSGVIKACKLTAKVLGLEENTNFQTEDFSKKKIDERFDLVICSEVLEHIKNDKLAVKKLFNFLKSEGILLLSVPSQNAPLFRLGLIKEFDKEVGHLRRYNLNGLVNLLREPGFRILETRKSEGILRNSLFVSRFGSQIVRVANRFEVISDILTFLDNITLKLFGESQIIVVAQKHGKGKNEDRI